MTEIINIKTYQNKDYIPCCRGTLFGNPFEIGLDGTREQVIEKYRVHFNNLIKDERFLTEIFKLKDKKLGCYCSPEKCHVEIIKQFLETNEIPKLKLKVAIIGSRSFSDKERMKKFLINNKEKIEIVVSGGASGADKIGTDTCNELGIPYIVFPAEWYDKNGKLDRGAGFKRNWSIVKFADLVVAFYDGVSKGTKNSLEIAEKLGKRRIIYKF